MTCSCIPAYNLHNSAYMQVYAGMCRAGCYVCNYLADWAATGIWSMVSSHICKPTLQRGQGCETRSESSWWMEQMRTGRITMWDVECRLRGYQKMHETEVMLVRMGMWKPRKHGWELQAWRVSGQKQTCPWFWCHRDHRISLIFTINVQWQGCLSVIGVGCVRSKSSQSCSTFVNFF